MSAAESQNRYAATPPMTNASKRDIGADIRWGLRSGLALAAAWPLLAFVGWLRWLLRSQQGSIELVELIQAWATFAAFSLIVGLVSGVLRPLTKTDIGHFVIGSIVGLALMLMILVVAAFDEPISPSWRLLGGFVVAAAIGGVAGSVFYYGREFGPSRR